MKTIFVLALLAASAPVLADQMVQGHIRSDGTYVAPYMRSTPNGTSADNYSTQGNYNPYTHQRGTQQPVPAQSTPNPYGNYKPISPYSR